MTWQIAYVFSSVLVAGLMFALTRVRSDLIALLVLTALILGGVVDPNEAITSFGDPVVVLLAGLFIIGDTLIRTGVAQNIGLFIQHVGRGSEARLMVALMVAAAVIGSVMSSTAVTAIFVPIVLNIATKTGINARRLLLPLSYGALMSGMLTLIGTPPNLVVDEALRASGAEGFAFFTLTPVGFCVLILVTGTMVFFSKRLLPGDDKHASSNSTGQKQSDMLDDFKVGKKITRFLVAPGCPMAGKTIGDAFAGEPNITVVGIERRVGLGTKLIALPSPELSMRPADVLLIGTFKESIIDKCRDLGLTMLPTQEAHRRRWVREVGLAMVLVKPGSRLIGKTVIESRFRTTTSLHMVAMRRKSELIDDLITTDLKAGDVLLVVGSWTCLRRIERESDDLVVLTLPEEYHERAPGQLMAIPSVIILIAMVLMAALHILPLAAAVVVSVVAAVVTRCTTMDRAYRSIDWPTLVLVAGMLPVAKAMVNTGAVDWLIVNVVDPVSGAGPYVMLSAIFFMTAGLGLFMSNTATAVLISPIAVAAAGLMGISPMPFAMAVAIGASAAYIAPFSTSVTALVIGPGNYRVTDFIKAGIPMLLLTWLVVIIVIPLVYPFRLVG